MDIKTLREIGKKLFEEVRSKRHSKSPLQKGAGGDITFPIDKLAEDIIISALEKKGEPLSIISEEAGLFELKGGGDTVLIDPIDGSKNAVTGIPFFGASIAIAEGNRVKDIKMSYIINLASGDEFWAEKSMGAFQNSIPMKTEESGDLRILAYEAQVPGRDISLLMPLIKGFYRTRCLGATALDLAYLASGAISVFATPALSRSFDFAGGYLMVKEAGGIITDINGSSIEHVELGVKKSTTLLASGNESLHKKALSRLRQTK